MKTSKLLLASTWPWLAACADGSGGASSASSYGRNVPIHRQLKLDTMGVSSASVSAQLINIGVIYLESQLAPPTVSGGAIQANDVSMRGVDGYISYSNGGTDNKFGAIEHIKGYNCDNPLTLGHVEYCMTANSIMSTPSVEIFSTYSDGTNLYAVGSTASEDALPYFGRLLKISLDGLKDPGTILLNKTLPSYAGTGVAAQGTRVYVTSGTSTNSTLKGGLSILNATDLSTIVTQPIYDARAVGVDPTNSARVFISRALDGANPSALQEYNSDGTGTALRTINMTGNTIAESKSGMMVGNSLILASMGDQGFRVLCKATGATLATVGTVTVSGIPASRTVTNSVAAAPGYIFAANGEAGVYVYKFKKTNVLTSGYCNSGVTLTFLGRLALDSDNSDTTYVNGELSANSIRYTTLVNALGVITAKLLFVASGNKGVSLINISDISILSADVDDFP